MSIQLHLPFTAHPFRCPKCGSNDLQAEFTVWLRLGDPDMNEDPNHPVLDDFDQVNNFVIDSSTWLECQKCMHAAESWQFRTGGTDSD